MILGAFLTWLHLLNSANALTEEQKYIDKVLESGYTEEATAAFWKLSLSETENKLIELESRKDVHEVDIIATDSLYTVLVRLMTLHDQTAASLIKKHPYFKKSDASDTEPVYFSRLEIGTSGYAIQEAYHNILSFSSNGVRIAQLWNVLKRKIVPFESKLSKEKSRIVYFLPARGSLSTDFIGLVLRPLLDLTEIWVTLVSALLKEKSKVPTAIGINYVSPRLPVTLSQTALEKSLDTGFSTIERFIFWRAEIQLMIADVSALDSADFSMEKISFVNSQATNAVYALFFRIFAFFDMTSKLVNVKNNARLRVVSIEFKEFTSNGISIRSVWNGIKHVRMPPIDTSYSERDARIIYRLPSSGKLSEDITGSILNPLILLLEKWIEEVIYSIQFPFDH